MSYGVFKMNIKKYIIDNKKNLTIIALLAMFTIILFKQVISSYLSQLITLIPSFVVFIWFLIMFFRGKIKLKSYDIFFAIMLMIGAFSGIFHNQKLIAVLYQIKSLGIYYLLFMIIRNLCFQKDDIKKILKYVNIITIVLISFSIVEIIFSKDILFPKSWAEEIVYADNFIRAYSLICNPNVFGFYLLLVLLYNYKFGNIDFSLKNVIFYSLIFTGIIISISRSSIICMIVLLFILLIDVIRKRKDKEKMWNILKLSILIAISAACLSLIIYKTNRIYENYVQSTHSSVISKPTDNVGNVPQVNPDINIDLDDEKNTFIDRIFAVFDSKFLNDSLNNGRLAIVKYGLNIWQKNILIGTGFSSFLSASSFLNPNIEASQLGLEYADNQYMTIIVETGLLGTLALLVSVLLFVLEQFKSKRYLSIVATFIIAFFGLFINSLEVQLIAFMYFLFVGLEQQDKEVTSIKSSRKRNLK